MRSALATPLASEEMCAPVPRDRDETVVVNPLVYVSEGLRGALTPSLPHMSMIAVLAPLLVMTVGFGVLGMRSFERRAMG